MASEDESIPKLPKRDARLERFLRHAGPIIAAERGMTPTASVKLQSLADEMQLPAELFEQAMMVLQQGPPQVRRHNRYERAFMAYLERELSKRSSEIVTHEVEQKALKHGETKYQLDVARARELFGQVVKQVGKRRISATEAERHVEATIREVVQEAVWVDIETRQRLIVLGEEWGVAKEHVLGNIELVCRLNRERQRSDQRRMNLLVAMVGLTIIAVVAGVSIITYRRVIESADVEETETSSTNSAGAGTFTPPAWWDESLRLAMGNAIARVSGFREWGADLGSTDATRREQAYQRLITTLDNSSSERETSARLQAVLFGILATEPEDNIASRTTKLIVSTAQPPNDGLPSGDEFYRRGWNTIELLANFTSLDEYSVARREMVRIELANLTETLAASAGEEGLKQYRSDYLQAMAEHLLAHARANPSLAIQRFEQLTNVGRDLINDDQRRLWMTELTVELLQASPSEWRRLRTLLDAVTLRANQDHVPAMLEFIEVPQEPDLAKHLAQRIKENYKLTTTTDAPDEVAMALRQQLGLSAAVVQRAPSYVWNQLGSKVTAANNASTTDLERLVSKLVELSHLNSIALRLVIEPGKSAEAVKALTDGAPEIAFNNSTTPPTPEEVGVTDVDSFRRLVDRIKSIENASIASALATLRAIGDSLSEHRGLIGRRDLALPVARYLVDQRDAAEQRRLLTAAPMLSRWPDLLICLADELDSPRTRPERTAEVYRAIYESDLELSRDSMTVEQLRQRLLEQGLAMFEGIDSPRASRPLPTADSDGDAGSVSLPRAMAILYSQRRVTLGGVPTTELSNNPSDELVAALRQWIVWSSGNQPSVASTSAYEHAERQLQALSYLAKDEVQVSIAAQRVWIDLIAVWISASRPDATSEAQRMRAEYENRSRESSDAVDQLIDGEQTMLRLWMLMR